MKRKYSLKRNEEIAKIVHQRRFVKNNCFVIYYQNNLMNQMRVCISVSKKLGIAVIRNKCKRQVREMVDQIFDFNLNKDYVIVVKNEFLNNDFITNKNKLMELNLKIISKNKENVIDEKKCN